VMEYNKGNISVFQCPSKQQIDNAHRSLNRAMDDCMNTVVKITHRYSISKEDW